MPWLCRICQSEADGPECEWCACPTVEVNKLFELKIEAKCIDCGASITTRVDHDQPNTLSMEKWEFKYCPVCKETTNHEKILRKAVAKHPSDDYLAKTLAQEIKIGER
jgi:ssDNA-binding Zn-finger/Zn-ribbon topoisomerase 1